MKNGFILIAIFMLAASPSLAQRNNACDLSTARHMAAGYVGSFPKEWMGFCFFSTKPEGVGLYLDIKASVPMIYGGDDFYENISIHDATGWGDPLSDTQDTWISGNVGMTKVLLRTLALYAGVGYSVNTTYHNYYDPMHILGTNGSYWVEGESESSYNVLGGMLVTIGERWGLQGGCEFSPRGFTLGVFYIM